MDTLVRHGMYVKRRALQFSRESWWIYYLN